MGGPRFVALALLAPLFGMPASAAVTAHSTATPRAVVHVRHEAAGRVAADGSVPSSDGTSAGLDGRTDTRGADFTARLNPPKRVHLLAARLYWGARHPGYPSTTKMRHDLGKVSDWYAHVSRGREHVRVTITRWVRVRASGDAMCNTQRRSIDAARSALRRAGYHPNRFNRLMIFTEQCDAAASAAQLPGQVSWVRFRAPGIPTLVHELGHNLGLEHAYGVRCLQSQVSDVPNVPDVKRVALGGSCTPVEYGDSWDAMGHSSGFFSAQALIRLGWAGRIQDVTTSGTYTVADVANSGSENQALQIRDPGANTTYWVEYQPEHSPQVGRTIPGVMIRREVGHGPVEIIDASPGNPAGIAFPDRDLTNPALPVGSSLTTPVSNIRIRTVSTSTDLNGRRQATVEVTFGTPSGVPDAPSIISATQGTDGYDLHWEVPADSGQIVLGYLVTSTGGLSAYVRSPAGYRTAVHFPLGDGQPQTFTVQALNQNGLSVQSAGLQAVAPTPTP